MKTTHTTRIRALRCLNAGVTASIVVAALLLGSTDVFFGMVVKPLLLIGLMVAAAWFDERLSDQVLIRKPMRRAAQQSRAGDRRSRARAGSNDRRAQPLPADATARLPVVGSARRQSDAVRATMLAGALLLPLAAFAETHYIEGGHYTVSLQPSTQLWRVAPMHGTDIEILRGADCPNTVLPGNGLWLLGRDAEGRVELVAISGTELAPGDSGRIALRACDDPGLQDRSLPAYGVPRELLARLEQESGAVLVHEDAPAALVQGESANVPPVHE